MSRMRTALAAVPALAPVLTASAFPNSPPKSALYAPKLDSNTEGAERPTT